MKMMIRQIPVPIAGLALGLTALGNLLQPFSELLRWLCGGVATGLMLLLFLRFLYFWDEVKADFENPVIASVSATIFMTFMQIASYVAPFAPGPAQVLWFAALVGHGVLVCWFTKKFCIPFRWTSISPTCFVTYVGLVVGTITSPVFSRQSLGMAVFWFGAAAYVTVFVLITYRCMKYPLEESAKPLLCIYTAPMSLCLTGYLAASAQPSLVLMVVVEVLAQILYGVVLLQMPKMLKLPFYPSYAAFTFPFVITAFGLMRLLQWLEAGGYAVPQMLSLLCLLEIGIATVLVSYTLIRYGVSLWRKVEGRNRAGGWLLFPMNR